MRRGLSKYRCQGCEIRKPLCFCAHIPKIELQTQLIVIMHTAERVLTTNTARLAAKALTNSEIRVRGLIEKPIQAAGLKHPQRHSLLLYPSEQAAELNEEFVSRLSQPVTLIVPDGSWRQTRRMIIRETALHGIPHVTLPPGLRSEYRLRHQPHGDALCTFEAIARAIGVLESREAQSQMETLLRVMVERTLWTRGMIAEEQCTAGGIPREAIFGP
jgi:DTW domain-containing protein YfiP